MVGNGIVPNHAVMHGIKIAVPDDRRLDVAIQFLHSWAGARWNVVLQMPRLQMIIGRIGRRNLDPVLAANQGAETPSVA